MPGFDGTGPRGLGPLTGGGRGVCQPTQVQSVSTQSTIPAYRNLAVGGGRGMGRGRGGGRGMGRGRGRGRWLY